MLMEVRGCERRKEGGEVLVLIIIHRYMRREGAVVQDVAIIGRYRTPLFIELHLLCMCLLMQPLMAQKV